MYDDVLSPLFCLPEANIFHFSLFHSSFIYIFAKETSCSAVFKSTPTQFQTIIYANVDEEDVTKDVTKDGGKDGGDVSEIKLSERQENILKIINESPTISGRKMSEMLSVSQRTIERDLAALTKIGILQHKGKDNDGEWLLTELGQRVFEESSKKEEKE